jgi:hypothetical protein
LDVLRYLLELFDTGVTGITVTKTIRIDVEIFIPIFHDKEYMPIMDVRLQLFSFLRSDDLPWLEGKNQIWQSNIFDILLHAVN